MRNLRLCSIILTAALLAGLIALNSGVAQSPAPKKPIRIAVCDLVSVFRNYQRVNDLNTDLKEKQDKLIAEEQQRQQQIQTIQAELEVLAPDSQEYQKRFNETLRQTYELEAWKKTHQAQLYAWHYRLTKEMFGQILQVISETARQKGYDLVLFKESEEMDAQDTTSFIRAMMNRKVLYHSPDMDITVSVLTALNIRYQSAPPKP